ncbi:glycosyl hydrolase [Aurantiacibacter luteus]|uniref:Glycosyl hydrolase n=2 Tax=Aurantiacibacter luteus TaxID=1581420 RepID=A0A0G9MZJ3_9SPHN|nr:glycosyl hydrolase [Aurantiacibacter luteus]
MAQERPREVVLQPDLDGPRTEFEGWGTALAWFANITGGWPDAERERIADLLYGDEGLRWSIARYNIGGGARPGAMPLTQPGANVPGFWRQPEGAHGRDWWRPDDQRMWDWSADANQRWWLDAIARRVEAPIFEAFSNSPPWFMTVSGEVSGAPRRLQDNLREGMEDEFAEYLVRVTAELQKRHAIAFRTLSPVNEPGTDYWYAGNRQEGSHWSPARQAAMFDATFAALQRHGLETVVSGPDETNSELFVSDWEGYPQSTRERIGQLNVHSYGNTGQVAVRDIARAAGIRLWMSEVDAPQPGDPENFEGMTSALYFAEHVIGDLRRLEPSAWVFWQAVEDISARDGRRGSNWGLLKADLRSGPEGPHAIHITRKYWAMAQFSRFIRPGFELLPIENQDSVAAISPDGRQIVMVHVNSDDEARPFVTPQGWHRDLIVTDAMHTAQCNFDSELPPRSISTLVLTLDTGDRPCTAPAH